MDIQAARAKRSSMPNVPPPPISARMRATKAIHDHDMQPRTGLVDELERRLEQAERAEGEKPSPEQVKALALRMAEQRERAAEDPTQDMNRPEPSGDEPLDLSEPEDLGESGPFEERSAPRTKADLLREIRQRADRRTGQQEAEQRQIDPWQAQPPRGADTAARTAFRRSAHDVRGCERQTRRNGIPRPPRCRRSGHARPSRRTAQWS